MNPEFKSAEQKILKVATAQGVDFLVVVTDTNVAPMTEGLLSSSPRIVVEAGEANKNIENLAGIWKALVEKGATRRTMVVNVGGGMVSDMGGFAAATFKRGIPYINVPTTLLAAVDASIGGKTGIDFMGLKNEIGAFRQPEAVIPLCSLFGSLSEEEWLSGCGEVLKTAVLAGGDMLERVATDAFILRRDPETVGRIVDFCARFKKRIVEEDFQDKGRRRILNFGHTYGHALESLMLGKGRPLAHGIAVAYGLEYALRLSVERQGIGKDLLERYGEILRRYYPPLALEEGDDRLLEELMGHDKKNISSGEPAFVLLGDI